MFLEEASLPARCVPRCKTSSLFVQYGTRPKSPLLGLQPLTELFLFAFSVVFPSYFVHDPNRRRRNINGWAIFSRCGSAGSVYVAVCCPRPGIIAENLSPSERCTDSTFHYPEVLVLSLQWRREGEGGGGGGVEGGGGEK